MPDLPPFSQNLTEFLESGVSVLIGTRDAALRPATSRCIGAQVTRDEGIVTLYLLDAIGERTLSNIRENGEVAAAFARGIDHRSIQLKGKARRVRPLTEAELVYQESYKKEFLEGTAMMGVSPALLERLVLSPCTAIEVLADSLFEQTPGPRAGERLSP